LKIALPDNLIQKYEERMAEDSITKAEVQGLFNCPFCTYAEIFEDEKQTVLECKNPECLKVFFSSFFFFFFFFFFSFF